MGFNPIIVREVGPDLKTKDRPELGAVIMRRFRRDIREADARHAAKLAERNREGEHDGE